MVEHITCFSVKKKKKARNLLFGESRLTGCRVFDYCLLRTSAKTLESSNSFLPCLGFVYLSFTISWYALCHLNADCMLLQISKCNFRFDLWLWCSWKDSRLMEVTSWKLFLLEHWRLFTWPIHLESWNRFGDLCHNALMSVRKGWEIIIFRRFDLGLGKQVSFLFREIYS